MISNNVVLSLSHKRLRNRECDSFFMLAPLASACVAETRGICYNRIEQMFYMDARIISEVIYGR